MPGCFRFEEQFFYVSSRRFADLLVYGAQVGLKTATDDQERAWANGLRERIQDLCQRSELTIQTDFPSFDERKFWSRVFDDLSYLTFRREVAADDPGFQDGTAVADAWVLAYMIKISVPYDEERKHWDVTTMAGAEIKKIEQERSR